MKSEANKKEPMFYVAIRANKENKNNEVARTDWIFDVQIYSEENSDESEAMESQIINIKKVIWKENFTWTKRRGISKASRFWSASSSNFWNWFGIRKIHGIRWR